MDVGAKVKGFMSYFTEPSVKKLLRLANIFGFLYFWILSLLVTYINLIHIIPSVSGNDRFWLHFNRLFFGIATFNMYLNYFICLRKKSVYVSVTTETDDTDELSAKGWSHCVPCQQYIPPRAHHCSICKHCVLKREMHCFFLGICIGHFNQRYFLVFLFYAAVGALHATLCFFTYLNAHFAVFLSLDIYNYFFYPIVTAKWIFGYVPSYLYGTFTLFNMCTILGIGSTLFFYFYFKRVLRGQTSHEFSYRIKTFGRGPQKNLEVVFGRHWWLAFVVPIPMKQSSDGIVWNKPKEIKGY